MSEVINGNDKELDYFKFSEEGMKDLILAMDTISNPHSKKAVLNALNANMIAVFKDTEH